MTTLVAVVTAAATVTPLASSASNHRFVAAYTGHAAGAVSGGRASGSATATGRGSIIGRSTLTGSGGGVFTSETCVVFNGTAVLSGIPGSIRLSAHDAHACATGRDVNNVSFSGRAMVTGGSATFAGVRGTLSFSGTYRRQGGIVRISFRGRLSY